MSQYSTAALLVSVLSLPSLSHAGTCKVISDGKVIGTAPCPEGSKSIEVPDPSQAALLAPGFNPGAPSDSTSTDPTTGGVVKKYVRPDNAAARQDTAILEQVQNRINRLPQDFKGKSPEALQAEKDAITALATSISDRERGRLMAQTVADLIDKVASQNATAAPAMPAGPGTPGNQPTAKDLQMGALQGMGTALPQKLMVTDPTNPVGFSLAGRDANYHKDYRSAFEYYGKAIDLNARDPQTYLGYGTAAWHLGDTRLAAESANMALRLAPGDRNAQALLKMSEGRVGSMNLPSAFGPDRGGPPQRAESPAQEATAPMAPQAPRQTPAEVAAQLQAQASAPPSAIQQSAGFTREAASSLTVKDYTSAEALATKAIELNPKNAQAWGYRAIADKHLAKVDAAIFDASVSLQLVPGNPTALQTRSWAFNTQKRYRDALADANYTLEREPRNGSAYFNRAFALAGEGNREEALESLKQAAQYDPRFQARYEAALQVPQSDDLLFLFDDGPTKGPVTQAPAPPANKQRRFLRLMILTSLGGVLVALGLLHIFSASWREKVRHTIRRALGTPQELAAEGGSAAGPSVSVTGGFWNQYTLSRELGSGGMGIVYEAQDRSLDRRVAVKKMRDEIRVDPQERARFVNEARTVASLHHPNIVDIYAIVEEDSDVYLVFEYVSGTTLSDRLREKGPLSFDEGRRVLKGICDAVEYAHRNSVIHRDLKPSNVMITEDNVVKVMDFGVARQAKDAMTKMSMTNTIVGTPPYMAPEQEQGTVRKESDVFALGICFYEMLTGRLPFMGVGAGMLLNKINGKHIPLSHITPNMPFGLEEVMAKALACDPDKRYRTPAEFLAAVEGLATGVVLH